MLSAACAVAWLSEASPKQQTTTASSGHGGREPSCFARSSANATPTARGRCEAIVDVCGMTASSWLPKTLWRPPAIGSSRAAVTPAEHVGHAVAPDLRRPREVEAAGAVVEQRRVGRPQRERDGGVRLVARPSRSSRSSARASEVARGEVAEAAVDLGAPERLRLRRGRRPARPEARAARSSRCDLERVEVEPHGGNGTPVRSAAFDLARGLYGSSARTSGATSVPSSSIARRTFSCGIGPTVSWSRKRSCPNSSCWWRIFSATSCGEPTKFAPRSVAAAA